MRKSTFLATSLLALNLTLVFGQQTPPPATPFPANAFQPPNFSPGSRLRPAAEDPTLAKFNLDFPGGTPIELVAAIEKATGKPLNAIIPKEDADLQMPPLKMSDVVVPQLFAALKAASQKQITVSSGGFGAGYSTYNGDYGFETGDNGTDASIWYFHVNKPNMPPSDPLQKVCQFYSLSPYLDRGFTVDDITTAIQIGWKMAGVTPTPELNYHKETKLLIAFGEPNKLKTIDNVLQTLPQTAYSLPTLDFRIKQLQTQVDQMKMQLSNPEQKLGGSPEEKPGK